MSNAVEQADQNMVRYRVCNLCATSTYTQLLLLGQQFGVFDPGASTHLRPPGAGEAQLPGPRHPGSAGGAAGSHGRGADDAGLLPRRSGCTCGAGLVISFVFFPPPPLHVGFKGNAINMFVFSATCCLSVGFERNPSLLDISRFYVFSCTFKSS